MRTFTTDGPIDPDRHYHMPAAPRFSWGLSRVEYGAYFVLLAPPRTGKTTTLRAFAAELTASGLYAALVCPADIGEPLGDDLARAEAALLSALRIAAESDLPLELRPPPFPEGADGTRLWMALEAWAKVCPLQIVLIFDGIDALHGAALRSVVRQLDVGFSRRPAHFPRSVILSAQTDLRHELSATSGSAAGTSGPFRLEASTEALDNFTQPEVRAFVAQYTKDTGRAFDEAAISLLWEATAGHPFLVQVLCREAIGSTPGASVVTEQDVREASFRVVEENITPIDDLARRLSDPRLVRVLEPLLAGTALVANAHEDDVRFARELGLLCPDDPARIAGGIHRALVPRLLAAGAKRAVTDDLARFFKENDSLDVDVLLHGFASFFSTHGEAIGASTPYEAIRCELVFLGYLYRLLEGRGSVDVEYGGLRGRMEVTITLPILGATGSDGTTQTELFVLVSRREGGKGAKSRGLGFLEARLEELDLAEGALLVFDRRAKKRKGARVKLRETTTAKGRKARVLRA